MTAIDSPVASRFVAAPDNWSRGGWAPRGVAIHMAEGGGTVSWLTRDDGNSSHYVVEYSGNVVQMVDEARAAGSINPKTLRQTNDAPFVFLGETVRYGRAAVLNALGIARANDPNRSVIAIEVEGFAATGPNGKQRAALARLVNDIRRRRGPQATLGHRDFQSYKACPGKKVPWVDYGGHAEKVGYQATPAPIPTPPEVTMIPQFLVPEAPTRAILKEDPSRPGNSAWIFTTSACVKDGKEISLAPVRPLNLVGFASADVYMVAYEPSVADPDQTSKVYFAKVTDILRTEPIPGVNCAAIAAELEVTKTKLGSTTSRLETVKAKVAANAVDVADD